MRKPIPTQAEIEYSPSLTLIDSLQRSLALTQRSLDVEFHQPWDREIVTGDIINVVLRRALLRIEDLGHELDQLRQRIEWLAEDDANPLPW